MEATTRALRAIGLTRAQGLTFYGHLIGLTGDVPAGGQATLRLEGDAQPTGRSVISTAALATLVDMAMGSAVRSLLEPGILMTTVALAVQHRVGATGPIEAQATALPVLDGHGLVQCVVRELGTDDPIGHAQAWFAVVAAPPGVRPGLLPWEYADPPLAGTLAVHELDQREHAMVVAAQAAERRCTDHSPLSQELVSVAWSEDDSDQVRGVLAPGPELENRAGQVQGGILYGAATMAAERALGVHNPKLIHGHYQFLRPASGTLAVNAAACRKGRSAAFARVEVVSGTDAVGMAQFAIRP